MAKQITRIVLTGGPAAGKTTLISRILKEFKQDEGWKVITIPETATELISGFGIKPFGGCVSMLDFQDFVVSDQLHKEQLGPNAADRLSGGLGPGGLRPCGRHDGSFRGSNLYLYLYPQFLDKLDRISGEREKTGIGPLLLRRNHSSAVRLVGRAGEARGRAFL